MQAGSTVVLLMAGAAVLLVVSQWFRLTDMVIFMFFGAPIVLIAGWYLFRGLGSGGGDDSKK
jgi:hypothetical protein